MTKSNYSFASKQLFAPLFSEDTFLFIYFTIVFLCFLSYLVVPVYVRHSRRFHFSSSTGWFTPGRLNGNSVSGLQFNLLFFCPARFSFHITVSTHLSATAAYFWSRCMKGLKDFCRCATCPKQNEFNLSIEYCSCSLRFCLVLELLAQTLVIYFFCSLFKLKQLILFHQF